MGAKKLKTESWNPFREWYEKVKKDRTQVSIADELGVPHQSVSNWIHGHHKPTGAYLFDIHKVTDIPCYDLCLWLDGRED